jgi:mono/diheme cytochrome c family protein
MRSRKMVWGALSLAVLGTSTVALGLPWDIDMADGQQRKAYSFEMAGLPEGVVAQPSRTSPKGFAPNYVRGTPEGEALVNPLQDNEQTREMGRQMFGIYCAPCHGADGINLGPVAQPGRLMGVVPLAGPVATTKTRTDGYLYLTVRNGGNVMPPYGWAMSEEEMWSVVAFVRTLDNAKFVPPEGR